jgi:BirA family biotin operon repressor/biotin-[acetyl-CoA-carboxylase] ligase
MLALAAGGAPEGKWLRAARQTGGRGRLGRAWDSPDGNLYASTLVRLQPGDPSAPTLALVAAVAVHALVAPLVTGQARIKWPNDILVDGAKLSGILLERAGDDVIIGIGINVAGYPEGLDRPVTSLHAQGATETDAAALLAHLARIFAHWLAIWRVQGIGPVRNHWVVNAHPAGTAMRVTLPDGTVLDGHFETMDAQGSLILRLANGDARAIHAGDVFLI